MKRRLNIWLVSAALAVLLAVAMLVCSTLGVVHFGRNELLHSPIFWNLRLPRVVLSVLVGAALSVCGATYQSVFRNPLTDPYGLGISSGASLGAAIAIVLGLQAYLWGVGAMALLTALLTIVLIFKVASTGNRMHTTTLLLTGVCLTFLITAVISLLMAMHHDKMESIIFWTMGSFASASWMDVAIVLPVTLVGLGIVLYHSKVTVMVAFSVSACGVIGFVGLVVPHCIRLVCGSDNRRIIPYSIFVGGLFLLLCDTVARTIIPPNELPVGSITSLLGAPMFIYLLYKSKRRI